MPIRLAISGRTDVGLVREGNEDAFVVAELGSEAVPPGEGVTRLVVGERGVLVAVSDGMGGHHGGEQASALTDSGDHCIRQDYHNFLLEQVVTEA